MLTSSWIVAHTWALTTTQKSSPKPHLHIHSHSFTDTPRSLLQTLASPRPHIMASHVDTRCHSLTHAGGACTYIIDTVTHTNSHMHSLSDGLTYGYHHILRRVHLPHRYHFTSKNSEFPSHPQPLIPLHSAVENTRIHIQNSFSVPGPWVTQAVLGGKGVKLRVA